MKKIVLTIVLSTTFILTSCSTVSDKTQSERWIWRWGMRKWWDTSDIIRLKSWSWSKQRFGSWSRMGSGSLERRFSELNAEEILKLRESMEARRSWDTKKADEIMKKLSEKHPNIFSWSMFLWWERNIK